MDSTLIDTKRREFLKTASLLCAGAIVLPESVFALETTDRSLQFYNVNTREYLDVTYFRNGNYDTGALKQLDAIMADRRSGDMARMNTALYDTIHRLHALSGSNEPLNLICGYRSPATNASMHAKGNGVAKHSYHSLGMAADISIPDVSLDKLRNLAQNLGAGGVGYYPGSGFIHVDVGPRRTWVG